MPSFIDVMMIKCRSQVSCQLQHLLFNILSHSIVLSSLLDSCYCFFLCISFYKVFKYYFYVISIFYLLFTYMMCLCKPYKLLLASSVSMYSLFTLIVTYWNGDQPPESFTESLYLCPFNICLQHRAFKTHNIKGSINQPHEAEWVHYS